MQARIEQLEQIADELFAEGKNSLGNQLLEIVYCLEAEAEELAESDGQPDEMQEWESFDPDC
jgi:hypothetical protein